MYTDLAHKECNQERTKTIYKPGRVTLKLCRVFFFQFNTKKKLMTAEFPIDPH